jgi:hypothetical protein
VPDAPSTLVADGAKNAGWPRVTKTAADNVRTIPAQTTRYERKIITERHERRPKHWSEGRDPVVTSAISKKKQKTKTSDAGFTRFQR